MNRKELNRRDFNRLSMAAFGGVVAGTMAGCGGADEPGGSAPQDGGGTEVGAAGGSPFLQEPNVCRGLNVCKGQGKGGMNECAGRSACATAKAHGCHEENACRGQGGCEDTAGRNECKGKGNCAVPIGLDSTWQDARAAFEAAMKEAGKEFGDAPPAG